MKKALVIGGARSGKYIALLLNENKYKVVLTDINEVLYKEELEKLGVEVIDKGHPDSLLTSKYDLVIKNPGIKYTVPFIQKLLKLNYKIYSEIDIALQYANNYNVCAITGTNGKTTTTTLLALMLKRDFKRVYAAGNIGVPVSKIVYENGLEPANLALELSSFQLDGIYNLKPHIANITNLKPDHLDYYNSVDDYYLSKQKIYKNQDESDFLLVNIDDEIVLKYLDNPKAKLVKYSLYKPSDINIIDNKVYYNNNLLFNINEMKLVGQHNVYNGIVASIMAYLSGVKLDSIREVMHTYKGVEHRIEYVDTIFEVKYYNDSKATNIDSTIVALNAFKQPVILIAGGYDKKISFNKLLEYTDKVKEVILFGQTKAKLNKIFLNATLVDNLEEAVQYASKISKKDDVVLFSPACASFDQFKDYEQRGNIYKIAVEKLKQ